MLMATLTRPTTIHAASITLLHCTSPLQLCRAQPGRDAPRVDCGGSQSDGDGERQRRSPVPALDALSRRWG
jgi:hypothetical protein